MIFRVEKSTEIMIFLGSYRKFACQSLFVTYRDFPAFRLRVAGSRSIFAFLTVVTKRTAIFF